MKNHFRVILATAFLPPAICAILIFTTSCAQQRNSWKSKGGFWASVGGGVTSDYVVISQSGGKIMDVWKLKDVMVQSPEGSDGWLFFDGDGNSIFIGGDSKIIRCKDSALLDRYKEYHMELETLTYQDKFADHIKALNN